MTKLEGRVVQVDPPYMAQPNFDWTRVFVKAFIFIIALIILGPISIGICVGFLAVKMMFSFIFSSKRNGGSRFFSNLSAQVVGFFFTSKFFGSKASVPVRDVRLRDTFGQVHLVRIKGELVEGNVNVGDNIEVYGNNQGGTFMFRSGWNRHIRSKIRVRN